MHVFEETCRGLKLKRIQYIPVCKPNQIWFIFNRGCQYRLYFRYLFITCEFCEFGRGL